MMIPAKLLPLLVAGGIVAHSGDAVKVRLESVFTGLPLMVARHNMSTILSAAQMWYILDEELRIDDLDRFIRRMVKTKGKDPARDYWGTPYRHRLVNGKFYLFSAGPDRRFRSEDDLKESIKLHDF